MKMVNSNSFNTPAACCGEIYSNSIWVYGFGIYLIATNSS